MLTRISIGWAVWVLLAGGPARGETELEAHQRELLLAQLEDLVGRLTRSGTGLPGRPAGLEVFLAPGERRRFAGVVLEQSRLTLQGPAGQVIGFLSGAHDTGSSCTPPFSIRQDSAMPRLEIGMWTARPATPGGFDKHAPQDELVKLRDNLLWLEARHRGAPALLEVLGVLVDAECVRLHEARWARSTLEVSGRVTGPTARQVFEQALRERTGRIDPPPRLDLRLDVPPAPRQGTAAGLRMAGLDPADALLLIAEVSGTPVIFAGSGLADLSGELEWSSTAALLEKLLLRMRVPHKRWHGVMVASERLTSAPPSGQRFRGRSVDLLFHRERPGRVLQLLADLADLDLVPPGPDRLRLSAAIRDMPVAKAAQLTLWALGLLPAGEGRLLVPLPPGASVDATGPPGNDPVELWAAGVPLETLVGVLAGIDDLRGCPPLGTPVRLKARAPAGFLLGALLATHRRALQTSGTMPRLVPAGHGPAPAGAGCASPRLDDGADGYLALLERGGERRALVRLGGETRWVREGDAFDGHEVRRIHARRVLLRDAARTLVTLRSPPPGGCSGKGCSERTDLAKVPLAWLQLVGTAVVPGRSAAVVRDPEGRTHLLRPGLLVGRRCGRVTAVRPGAVEVSLGCRRPHDPRATRLVMPQVDDAGSKPQVDDAGSRP